MKAELHPEFAVEAARLEETLRAIDDQIRDLRERTPRVPPPPGRDPFTAGDRALWWRRARRLKELQEAKAEPYFARIDFREDGARRPKAYYVGKFEFVEMGVYDWRTPLGNLLYVMGPAQYTAPEGTISGEVTLQRRFEIRDGELIEITDMGAAQQVAEAVAGGHGDLVDPILLQLLERGADRRMRDIVSTIQAEQNQAIRAPYEGIVILEGVAGSSKTSVALHRVAYLLHAHRDTIRHDRVLVLGPTRLFIRYISNLLPSLREHGVQHMAYTDWALTMIGKGIRLDEEAPPDRSGFKRSVEFRNLLDAWLATYRFPLPTKDVRFPSGRVIRAEDVATWYMRDFAHFPPGRRILAIRERVRQWAARDTAEEFVRRVPALKGVSASSPEWRAIVAMQSPEVVTHLQRFTEETRRALAALLNGFPVEQMHLELWRVFLRGMVAWSGTSGPGRTAWEDASRRAASGRLASDELGAVMHIRDWLFGVADDERYDHVVVDEAQELGPLDLECLARRTRSMTISGDLSQVLTRPDERIGWPDVLGPAIPLQEVRTYRFATSYRCPTEIVTFARRVLERAGVEGLMPEGLPRRGRQPLVRGFPDETSLVEWVGRILAGVREEEKRAAVLTATEEHATHVYELLKAAGHPVMLLRPHAADQDLPEREAVVASVDTARGLEVDTVILPDLDAVSYPPTPASGRRLYTAATRAMRDLYACWFGTASPLVPDEYISP